MTVADVMSCAQLALASLPCRETDLRKVRVIHLEPTPFTPENGVLTPTLKLKRNEAREMYKQVIGDLYASTGRPTPRL